MRASSTVAGLLLLAALVAACDDGGPRAGDRSAGPRVGPRGCVERVLVIVDEVPAGADALAVALAAAGFDVTTSSASSSEYAGHPSLAGEPPPFGAVLLLAGSLLRSPPPDMPAEGQRAIVDFVGAGHGLVLTEWAAFHVAAQPKPRWQILEPLVLLGRAESTSGQVTYQVDPAFASHPIWAGLPASFTFTSTSNVGAAKPAPGVATVARSPQAKDAVAIRELAKGRVVHLAHAGNHVQNGWSNVNVQRLVTNAVGWAAGCR